ncbi:DNA polymerase-3 subunit epsilon [Azospirillum lipoferum]|uniref:DNA polymerase III subunit epsilon n=1 Tax=Azospirillum lipoferum TaxID=193 RepID=A0A5A9GVP5_AZOLI|nr:MULTISPECIES: DNA polymerase III subunit epsilon [Azospirillum]KAA0597624.1 DNA polymerase III subunit epsilon [Azospirillum lipoferum]MCP1610255.1 DNA polymerase-3 subunit epsilon [Azospirillum lipoferum]MDW5534252.1 DNA polymerase III subunit epsilon [Azospirillum sp. NL1]
MREIVLDTETTGFKPEEGHRLVEIGCIELVNHLATGERFHVYLNPERDMPPEAFAVHGLSTEFLADKPLFNDVAADFVNFIGDAPLVIHNAAFDMHFLNWELKIAGYPVMPKDRAVDTLLMARQKFPGSPATLDALCKRFGVDNSNRTLHGALLDAQLLAEVYLELLGGRQTGLSFAGGPAAKSGATGPVRIDRPFREARVFAVSDEEAAAHAEMLKKIKNPLWAVE